MKNGCAITDCKCQHEFQDKTYGKNMRVMNSTAKQDDKQNTATVRCTVCGVTKEVKQSQVK